MKKFTSNSYQSKYVKKDPMIFTILHFPIPGSEIHDREFLN